MIRLEPSQVKPLVHRRSDRSPLSAQRTMESSRNGSGQCNPQGSAVQGILIAFVGMALFSSYLGPEYNGTCCLRVRTGPVFVHSVGRGDHRMLGFLIML